jgi:GT2 family glycosyltransferase
MDKSHTTFAIVVTYNGAKWIDKCFGSLVDSNIPVKILAIDNASSDGTPNIIKEKYPQVEVIETGQNLGFGKANNIGLKRVLDENADYAFLLNQDAWVEQDTLEKLVGIQKQNPDYQLLSPIHLNGQGDAIDRNFQTYLGNNWTPGFYSDLYLNKLKSIYEGKHANAAAWLLTRFCLETVGGFDPLFKHYGEDDDYLNRLRGANLKLGIVPLAIIFHDRPQTGRMNDAFYINQVYTKALLSVKGENQPNHSFLLRKIIANYFAYYFAFTCNNKELKSLVKTDIQSLKIKRKALLDLKKQKNGRAFLD